MQENTHRNAQFENITRIKSEFAMTGNPMISMDTKKKEYLGNFYRDGRVYTLEEALVAFDHDFYSFAEGIIMYFLKIFQGF